MLPLCTRVTLATVVDRVLDRLTHEALAAEGADGLDAETGILEELRAHLLAQELREFLVLRRAGGVLDAGVDVFGVLTKDHHIDRLGFAHRRRHAGVIAHRPHAGVQIEILAQRDVQERKPPPTGVVSGPLMDTPRSRNAVSVSSG